MRVVFVNKIIKSSLVFELKSVLTNLFDTTDHLTELSSIHADILHIGNFSINKLGFNSSLLNSLNIVT